MAGEQFDGRRVCRAVRRCSGGPNLQATVPDADYLVCSGSSLHANGNDDVGAIEPGAGSELCS